MTVLPIVERELRVAARQRVTYWVRLGIALAAILVGAVVFVLTFGLPPPQTGRHIFEWLAGIMMVYCLAFGRRSTADCLSVEKREGTLGLLFLTDLKGHDVVLGKLVATSVRGFYGLLAVFPVLAIPLLLGGITSGEFWRTVLVLMDTFLLSLAIGILGSALSRDQQRALAANLALLLFLMVVPAACMYALEYFAPGLRKLPQLLFSCPVYAFYLCDDAHYGMASDHFWWTVGVIHGLTWLLVMTAGWIAPRSWQDRPSRAEDSRRGELWHAWTHGPAAGRGAFRRRALDANAFYWLAARARFKPLHVWTFLACMALWWLVCWTVFGGVWLDPVAAVVTALLLNLAFKVWLAIEAGQQLAEDRRTGAFELLLSVPLTVQDIVRGQLRALRRQFLWPVVAGLGAGLFLLLIVRRRAPGAENQAIWLVGMFMLVADLVALSWVGMWQGLVSRSHNLATVSTLTRVLILPWAVFGAVVAAYNAWFELVLGKHWDPGWEFVLKLWMGLGLAADLFFGLTAWWQLRTRFRELALRRFNPVPSGFARWFGPAQAGGAGLQPAGTAARDCRLYEPQLRDERREDAVSGTSAVFAPRRFELTAKSWRIRLALACCLALVAIGLGFIVLRPRSHLTPAVVVSLNQSNGPVRVFSSSSGVVLILPDGSLWRWGNAGAVALSVASVPEQVGTNQDWVGAAADYAHLVGLRRDGTLWEWGRHDGSSGEPPDLGTQPRPVDSSHDWVSVAATANRSVALRGDGTLWSWGDNAMGPLGIGTGPRHASPVQVGTNNDWAAVCCLWDCTLALRRDGTLWTWGHVPILGAGWVNMTDLPSPTQVCLESNWTGFAGGFLSLVWNRSGELWEPFHATPDPEVPAAANSRLVLPHAVPGRVATAWCGEPEIYEVRPDGTLWGRTQPLSTQTATPVGEWRRLGKRSDWTALWGAGGTALGLTADGTLWTWGIVPGGQSAPDLVSRLKLAQSRLMSLFGPGPRPIPPAAMPAYEKQPRPLMRMVLGKGAPPATGSERGER
jgi:ABC-type transport system involved in multi-copper enzyme maturation permease subunit